MAPAGKRRPCTLDAGALTGLGYDMARTPWTAAEFDICVADYFAMLAHDIAKRPYNKAAHRRALLGDVAHSEGSIEKLHQNISAVLIGMGLPWINGYKPLVNFNRALPDAVARVLHTAGLPDFTRPPITDGMAEDGALFLDTPPTRRNTPPPTEAETYLAIARKFDAAGRDARNRALGRAGEARVLAHERATLRDHGAHELAAHVRWTSEEDGDGAGFDIASFKADGTPRLIEVKTTTGWDRTPFHISRNELRVAKEQSAHWRLMRVYDFARNPRAFELRPPLEAHVALTATSFQADFH